MAVVNATATSSKKKKHSKINKIWLKEKSGLLVI
jgi:hypothetical protein